MRIPDERIKEIKEDINDEEQDDIVVYLAAIEELLAERKQLVAMAEAGNNIVLWDHMARRGHKEYVDLYLAWHKGGGDAE